MNFRAYSNIVHVTCTPGSTCRGNTRCKGHGGDLLERTFRSPTAPAADSKWPTCIFDAVMVTAQPNRASAEICRPCIHDDHDSTLFYTLNSKPYPGSKPVLNPLSYNSFATSTGSPRGVPVPCSSTAARSAGVTEALAQARRMTRSCASGSTEDKGFLRGESSNPLPLSKIMSLEV